MCNISARNLVASLANLTAKHTALEVRLAALEAKLDAGEGGGNLGAPPPNVGSTQSDLPSANSTTSAIVENVLNELQDQQRRERNIMIFGLSECQNADDEDSSISDIMQHVGVENDAIVSHQRLGAQRPDGSRAIKLKLRSVDEKIRALKNAKTLPELATFKKVYIKPDLTAAQLRKQKLLVDALKAANAGGKKMIIRGGKLVPFLGQSRAPMGDA